MPLDLSDRRLAAATALANLERERGAAILDDRPFDTSALAEQRSELEALDAAEAEAVRRERLAARERAEQAKAEARRELAVQHAAYLETVARAERAAEALVGELEALEGLGDTMRKLTRMLGGVSPVSLEPTSIKTEHSRMLATKLKRLGGACYYGCLSWNSVAPIPDWTEHARKFVSRAILPLIAENSQ